jgi:GNAT superfamily N-acetyltransferase
MSTFEVSDDKTRLDRDAIHRFLSEHAYWSRGIGRATVDRAIDGSLCFGAYRDLTQVGFARVVTDTATFAYLCDVFVLPPWRGQGAARGILEAVDRHPALQGLRRFLLFTADMHPLYAKFGFTPLARPERGMERLRDDVYRSSTEPESST